MKYLKVVLVLAALVLFVALGPLALAQTYRPLALGDIHAFVDPVNGHDTIGVVPNNCVTTPCQTFAAAVAYLRQIDVNCFTAYVNAAPGTYAESVTLYEKLVGQCGGPSGWIFRGDPANPAAQVIAPPAGPAFGVNIDARIEINGFKCDMLLNNATGQDCLQVQNGGNAILDSFVFGDNLNGYGDITATGSGSNLTARAWNAPCGGSGQPPCLGYQIAKTAITIQSSWPGPGGATNVLFVSSCAGVLPNMTVHGVGIPAQTVAVGCDPVHGYLTINNFVTGSASAQNIYLCKCGQHHVYVSVNAEMSYATNAGASPFTIAMFGGPTYYAATFVVSQSGTVNAGVNWTGGAAGNRYLVFLNGTLHAGSQSLSSLPGDSVVGPWLGGQAD